MSNILELRNISKVFHQGGKQIKILEKFNLKLKQKQIIALVGASGCGKSTLLHIAGLLATADSGQVIFNGQDCSSLSNHNIDILHRRSIGFVYQAHHLLPEFCVLHNVMLPAIINGLNFTAAREKAFNALKKLNMEGKANLNPGQLSGGERQKVAILRATINQPQVILADEPTGNLDHKSGLQVIALFINLVKTTSASCLLVTHNMEIAQRADLVIHL